jgi:hypothetical protein
MNNLRSKYQYMEDDAGEVINPSTELRVLPFANGNLILSFKGYLKEMRGRAERNLSLSKEAQFDLPNFDDLEIYKQ